MIIYIIFVIVIGNLRMDVFRIKNKTKFSTPKQRKALKGFICRKL